MAVTTNALASSPDTMPAFTLSEMVHDSSLCLVARVFATLQDLQLPDASTDAPAAGCSSSQPSPSASATGSQSMLSPPPSVVLASKRTQLVVAVCKPESASSHARDASPQPPNDACDDPLAPSNATQEPVQPLHASPLAIVVEVLLQKHCNSLGLSTVKRSAVNGSDTVVYDLDSATAHGGNTAHCATYAGSHTLALSALRIELEITDSSTPPSSKDRSSQQAGDSQRSASAPSWLANDMDSGAGEGLREKLVRYPVAFVDLLAALFARLTQALMTHWPLAFNARYIKRLDDDQPWRDELARTMTRLLTTPCAPPASRKRAEELFSRLEAAMASSSEEAGVAMAQKADLLERALTVVATHTKRGMSVRKKDIRAALAKEMLSDNGGAEEAGEDEGVEEGSAPAQQAEQHVGCDSVMMDLDELEGAGIDGCQEQEQMLLDCSAAELAVAATGDEGEEDFWEM